MKIPKTVFLDIDGTILKHFGSGNRQSTIDPVLLPGVLDKLDAWDRKNYKIILVTGRRESERGATEEQLQSVGIVYDSLIMGLGGGERVVINDSKEDSDMLTAQAICVKRNGGLVDVDI